MLRVIVWEIVARVDVRILGVAFITFFNDRVERKLLVARTFSIQKSSLPQFERGYVWAQKTLYLAAKIISDLISCVFIANIFFDRFFAADSADFSLMVVLMFLLSIIFVVFSQLEEEIENGIIVIGAVNVVARGPLLADW